MLLFTVDLQSGDIREVPDGTRNDCPISENKMVAVICPYTKDVGGSSEGSVQSNTHHGGE
jgi:hypothetical protein